MATRRDFIIGSVQAVGAVAGIAGHLSAASGASSASFVDVSSDTKTIAGEPLEYPSTPNPVIFSNVVTIPPATVTPWMIHPVPAYLYVLEGTLTVEFAADGSLHKFNAGQAFLQSRTHWHRGRNDGTTPCRFLGVFVGSKDVPVILHPPSGKSVQESEAVGAR
jgi:quercetin dioxygenase-like cupin family protein